MTDEHLAPNETGATREFSTTRKGYDPVEVDRCLAEQDEAFRELEEYALRLKHELNEARLDIIQLRANEQESIDSAMLAVFDAKDRIIQAATEKARAIEEEARLGVGAPDSAVPDNAPREDALPRTGENILAELSALVGEDGTSTVDPNDVLAQMQREAEVIRDRLDTGLAAAFDQMDQMQRQAEDRARDLLAEARQEANELRSAGVDPQAPSIAVTLTDTDSERPSRYSRNSAGLPRLETDDGSSVIAKMATLREKFREEDAAGAEADAASGVAGKR